MREIEVPMPKLSMTMEEGELITWVKQEGDQVRAGDVIAEVNSDKVEMEVESPADGTLVRHAAAEGEVVPVGAPIATLATEAEDLLGGLLGPAEGDGGATPAPAVDNREHAASGSATLPHRGAEPGPGSLQAAPEAEAELAVGFFGSRYERATPAERDYLRAMAGLTTELAADAAVSTTDVADVLGRKPSSLSPARDALLKKGLVYSAERGTLAFTVPHFARWLRTHPPA